MIGHSDASPVAKFLARHHDPRPYRRQQNLIQRGKWLHIRARNLHWVTLGLLLLSALAWGAAHWLASRPFLDGPGARTPVAVLAPLLAAMLVSTTLAGSDVDLERSTAHLYPGWRAVHAFGVGLVPSALLAATAIDQPQIWGSYSLVRNSAGMVGAVLLSAIVLPATVTWAPVFTYVVVVYLAAPHTPTPDSTWWAWPMQAGALDPSWVCAGILLTAGTIGYGVLGPPPVGGPSS